MAGLGAGAGAFEGDQHRDRMAMERARLNEQRRQFNINREEKRTERLQDREDRLDQRNWDREQKERDFKFKEEGRVLEGEKQEWERRQAEEKASWDKVVAESRMEADKSRRALFEAQLSEAKERARLEREALDNRKFMAQISVATTLRLARENNGIVPAAQLPYISEAIGVDAARAYLVGDDLAVDFLVGQDEQGNPQHATSVFPAADVNRFMEELYNRGQDDQALGRAAALKGRGRAPSGQQVGEGEGFDREAAVKQADWLLKEASRFEEAGDLGAAREYRNRADDLSAQVAGVNLKEARKSGAQRFLDRVSDRQSVPTNEEVAKIDGNIAKARDRLKIAPIEQRKALQEYIAKQEKLRKRAKDKARKPTRMESFHATVGPM